MPILRRDVNPNKAWYTPELISSWDHYSVRMTIVCLLLALQWELDYSYSYDTRMYQVDRNIASADDYSDSVY